ncbi:MAG: FAD-dependent oxidoreductase, partial [bacterium]
KEGTVVVESVAVAELLRERGALAAVRLVETEGGRPTRRERGVVPCDLLVLAIGQAKLVDLATSFAGVRCDARGRIVADVRTGQTGNPRVFTGGDAMNGGKEVVHAAHDGALAARSIDRLFRGEPVEATPGAPILSTAARPGAPHA